MQHKALVIGVRVLINVIHTLGVKRGSSALDAVHRCHGWQVDFFSFVSSLKLIIHQSMFYKDSSQQPIFNGLQPLWSELLPKDYDTLISSSALWEAFTYQNGEVKNALV